MTVKVASFDMEPKSVHQYPWLGIAKCGEVVLFTAPGEGTTIRQGNSEEPNGLGHSSKYWNTTCFSHYRGTLELSQE